MKNILIVFVIAIPLIAGKAKLYDLQSGKVAILEFKTAFWSGKGKIKGTMPNGQVISGEFRTTANQLRSSGEQHGSAVLTGEGVVLECDYIVDDTGVFSHGSGTCSDNKGNRYKLIF